MEVPIRSGSLYFNCKDRRSTVLMGNSDISVEEVVMVEYLLRVILRLHLNQKYSTYTNHLFYQTQKLNFPYFLFGDEGFNIQRKCQMIPSVCLVIDFRREFLQNMLFLIFCLQKPVIDDVKTLISITKAVVSLHNFFINETCYIYSVPRIFL